MEERAQKRALLHVLPERSITELARAALQVQTDRPEQLHRREGKARGCAQLPR